MSKLTLKTEGDRWVVVTRRFAAPPQAVFRAHTEPKLIQKWLLGPEGWTMPVCVNDARPGGNIRYEWSDGKGNGFHLTGEYVEVVPHSRIVHVERMFVPDPTPDNHVETRFEPEGAGTLMTMRMTLPDEQTRAAMRAPSGPHSMAAAAVMPAVPATASAPAVAAAEGITAPIEAGTIPAVLVEAIVAAAKEELGRHHR